MSDTPTQTEHRFELTGGRLCLDFVNTIGGDRAGEPKERLRAYGDLLSFAAQAGAIDPDHASRLRAEAKARPLDSEEALRSAIALRETLYRTFLATAEGREPEPGDLSRLSKALGSALAHRRLERRGGGWALGWDDPRDALDAPAWRVAASAADLLTDGTDLQRVRVCGMHDTHECSWVFMDNTRGRTRRWCSMKDCGNKAKARRHYRAKRGAGAAR